ncbi:MAG: FkbM family methyltransferase [Bacteroidales bacterium]|jgi:FkbM family methyltransferase|nr:FkbM family methyltransferase [Bacteroidales bacterium]
MILKKLLAVFKRDGFIFTSKRVLAYVIGHTPLSNKLSFVFYKNLRLYFKPSMLTYVLFANKNARDEDTLVLEKFIVSGATVIDVGAHIGSTTLISASLAGETGQVHAIEASAKFFDILNKNIELNQENQIANITTHHVALGDVDETIVYLNEMVNDDTTNHISNTGSAVTQITLDSIAKGLPTIDFLKIDVEGYEPQVLSGANETLTKTNTIYIEFCSHNLNNKEAEVDIIATLLEHFKLCTFHDGGLIPFTYQADKEYATNLIGIKN